MWRASDNIWLTSSHPAQKWQLHPHFCSLCKIIAKILLACKPRLGAEAQVKVSQTFTCMSNSHFYREHILLSPFFREIFPMHRKILYYNMFQMQISIFGWYVEILKCHFFLHQDKMLKSPSITYIEIPF